MGFLTVSISCRLSLRWEDIFQAEQNLFKLHVKSSNQTSATAEQQWIVVMYFGLFCVFFLTFCLSEAGAGQSSSCARLHCSYPQPQWDRKASGITADADGCAPRCTFPARKLSWECWKPAGKPGPTQGFFTRACAAKRSQRESSNVSCWSCGFFQTREGTRCFVRDLMQGRYLRADSLVPANEDRVWGKGVKFLASMYLSCLCKSPWLLIRMCHHLGSAVLAALGSETLAVGVGTPGCGSIEVHSLLLWENLMLLHPHQGLSPPSSSTPWLRKQYHLPPPSSQGHHLQQVKVLLHPQSGSVSLTKAFIAWLHSSAWS